MKRFARLTTSLTLASTLLLGACGDDSTTDSGADAVDVTPVIAGQLTVCSDSPYAPFEFVDEAGEHTGYDIEIMREVADSLELTLAVQVTPFDGILGSLEVGDCDVVASAVTIKPERAEQVDFSDPYYETNQSLMVKSELADELASLAALAGKKIGVQSGTTGADYATENKPDGAEVIEFPDAASLFSAIEAGEIDAILQDQPVNELRARQDESLEVVEVFQTDEQYGFAVKKGNTALKSAIDDTLERIRESGRLQEIFEEFFG